ncbi:MAG: DUF6172 family protein [Spirochaetales bacterium]|uniref:DUF6172 family protein n=1 Tax=Candidatus Thalassospirochaeta sargassi TaxID=3119039 RepID=A0AAJ1IBW3_9SPIO|nr:DUF6172 family protein [Spirochaetales bacterium]
MKKTFSLTDPKRNPDRMLDAAKYKIRKYLKREQKKTLPDGFDYWDFDCRYGQTEKDAEIIHVSAINKNIDKVCEQKLSSFYLEILAKPVKRKNKPG